MEFIFDERESDSPLVDLVWQTHSERDGSFISTAVSRCEMVITKYKGQVTFTVRGPETKATHVQYPADAEFFGIRLKPGAFMPHLPTGELTNNGIDLPEAPRKSFWLNSEAWELPTFENADVFIARLMRAGMLVHDPVVDAVLQNQPLDMSLRSAQRRFLRATGLTRGTFEQIERARQAVQLLEQGTSIADAVYHAGYADQPHLTRSLKRFVGQTPAQILRTDGPK
ncbi:MAG: helix-turn-helix transcriptional regulator [Anaerolineaceae bacterium]|nr:helix-turn-helix transcriptional regulator [Anaerolineaceae bacterium]MCB9099108.1 helix-turn-helix transcriptional regulator [Anaerolineales bacterium]